MHNKKPPTMKNGTLNKEVQSAVQGEAQKAKPEVPGSARRKHETNFQRCKSSSKWPGRRNAKRAEKVHADKT
jgi:hypothetical protein